MGVDLFDDVIYYLDIKTILSLSNFGAGNYHTPYSVKIFNSGGSIEQNEEDYEQIGIMRLSLGHIGQAQEHGVTAFDYLDANGPDFHEIFVPETFELLPSLRLSLQKPLVNPNILFIYDFQIFAQYRGLGIASKIIQLLSHHFKYQCGLIMARVEPYQFSRYYRPKHDDIHQQMAYHRLADDLELAQLKLMSYFTKMGFSIVSGFDDSIIYLETATLNVFPQDFHIT